ncbi:MAG: hypothetical protein SFZ03_11395 [Candidatus Melainabacteria bacterium]|nr:hypothetical protein [Candidatus Melainabacteria bacterium]
MPAYDCLASRHPQTLRWGKATAYFTPLPQATPIQTQWFLQRVTALTEQADTFEQRYHGVLWPSLRQLNGEFVIQTGEATLSEEGNENGPPTYRELSLLNWMTNRLWALPALR